MHDDQHDKSVAWLGEESLATGAGAVDEGTERAIAAMEPIREVRADEDRFRHLAFLPEIAQGDVEQLNQKEREYGASWKKRGGVGAFMMLARKWDRLENMVDELRSYVRAGIDIKVSIPSDKDTFVAGPYDIFSHIMGGELEGKDAEALLDTAGDLRRYLMLVEAECLVRLGRTPAGQPSEDSRIWQRRDTTQLPEPIREN